MRRERSLSRMRRPEGGFTLIELMVSMGLFVIGFVGIMALFSTTVSSNRQARNLGRAVDYTEQLMEELRGANATALLVGGGPTYGDIATADGMTYYRSYTVTPVQGSTSLVLVTGVVTYVDEEDPSTNHTQTMSMVRTTAESF